MSFDLKRMDDTVLLDLGIPMRTYPDGKIRGAPGFDAQLRHRSPARDDLHPHEDGERRSAAATTCSTTRSARRSSARRRRPVFEIEVGNGFTFSDHARYNDTDTVRNGVFPNTLQSAASFLTQQSSYLAELMPGATALQLRYVNGGERDLRHRQPERQRAAMIVGGLRGVTSPVQEFINDARLMRKFEFGSQTHDCDARLLRRERVERLLALFVIRAAGRAEQRAHCSTWSPSTRPAMWSARSRITASIATATNGRTRTANPRRPRSISPMSGR